MKWCTEHRIVNVIFIREVDILMMGCRVLDWNLLRLSSSSMLQRYPSAWPTISSCCLTLTWSLNFQRCRFSRQSISFRLRVPSLRKVKLMHTRPKSCEGLLLATCANWTLYSTYTLRCSCELIHSWLLDCSIGMPWQNLDITFLSCSMFWQCLRVIRRLFVVLGCPYGSLVNTACSSSSRFRHGSGCSNRRSATGRSCCRCL